MPSQKASTASARPSAATRAAASSSQTRVEIGGVAAVGFGRQRMRAEEASCATARPGARRRAGARPRSMLQLGLDVEPVAGLHLDRRHALGEQRVEPGQGGARRARPRSRARVAAHGRDDAAAGPRDLLVGRAREPQLELVRAVAAIDQMGVAIDEARRDPAAVALDRLGPPRTPPAGPPPGRRRRCGRRRPPRAPSSTSPRPPPAGRHGGEPGVRQIVSQRMAALRSQAALVRAHAWGLRKRSALQEPRTVTEHLASPTRCCRTAGPTDVRVRSRTA